MGHLKLGAKTFQGGEPPGSEPFPPEACGLRVLATTGYHLKPTSDRRVSPVSEFCVNILCCIQASASVLSLESIPAAVWLHARLLFTE